MKIQSTNIAKPISFTWSGKTVTTGIYKKPTSHPIYLTKNGVKGDEVSNIVNHGGTFKACYMFSAAHYPYWKKLYPHLDWNWGMFGENLTVSTCNENEVFLGDIYKVGNAVVRISQYREPCFKLGHKFGTQAVLKQFIEYGFGGTYLSVLEEGSVSVGDVFTLIKRPKNSLTAAQLFQLAYAKEKNQDLLQAVINNDAMPLKKRAWFSSYLKN